MQLGHAKKCEQISKRAPQTLDGWTDRESPDPPQGSPSQPCRRAIRPRMVQRSCHRSEAHCDEEELLEQAPTPGYQSSALPAGRTGSEASIRPIWEDFGRFGAFPASSAKTPMCPFAGVYVPWDRGGRGSRDPSPGSSTGWIPLQTNPPAESEIFEDFPTLSTYEEAKYLARSYCSDEHHHEDLPKVGED